MKNNDLHYWKILTNAVQEKRIAEVFQVFNEHKIDSILIKGWTVSRYYPTDHIRASGDIDVCVRKKDFGLAADLIKKAKQIDFGVDLHEEFKHLDKVSFDDLFANSQIINLDETPVRTLRPEDNLRVICVHWLTDSGANRGRLWDIYYAVANRPADFDWERCLNIVSKTRRKWIVCTIALAHRYLDLDVDELPIADEIKDPNLIPKWLIAAIEKEWREQIPLISIDACWNDWNALKQQIKKRFPPNPVQASIETEAPFNNFPRLPFQLINFFQRLAPSVQRNFNFFRRKRTG